MKAPAVTTALLPPKAARTAATDLRQELLRELGDDPAAADVLARWDRWGQDLLSGLDEVYVDPQLSHRLLHEIAMAHRARPQALRERDLQPALPTQ